MNNIHFGLASISHLESSRMQSSSPLVLTSPVSNNQDEVEVGVQVPASNTNVQQQYHNPIHSRADSVFASASFAMTNNACTNKWNFSNSLQSIETYKSCIQQYLATHLVENATFYAERLVAISLTSDSLYLLALCYYRQQKPQRTKFILQQHQHKCNDSPELLYLLAVACHDLEDYSTGEQALLSQVRRDFRKTECTDINQYILTTSPCPIPNGAAGLHLLAKICEKSNRKNRAIQYFKMSLELDPFLWKSFEALCNLGVQDIDPTSVFGVDIVSLLHDHAQMKSDPVQHATTTLNEHSASIPFFTPSLTPNVSHFKETRPNKGLSQQLDITIETPAPSASQRSSMYALTTHATNRGPAMGNEVFGTPNLTPILNEPSFAIASQACSRAVQRARKVAFRDYYEPSPEARTTSHTKPRSLFWGGISPTGELHKSSFSVEPKSTMKIEMKDSSVAPQSVEGKLVASNDDGVSSILELLCLLGMAQLNLGQFRSEKAILLYQKLPDEHFHTGWVLHQVGRAYFAMADYQNAIRVLQIMEQVEPHRMSGLEVLSTALWQTKREVELSHLAQRVTDFDRLSAEVWCVVGNCFSLQKEHETALTFFRRSVQLDPSFTYSHTLSGHDYFASEDFDKAVACYRDAIRADPRHYNAWYGLGAVYYRQEKFDLAEYHFRRACNINSQSSVLICHLGMAQNANGKPYEALDTLEAAFRLDPHNPQAHYQRALVYQALDQNEEALVELERVRDAAPREAQIHFSIGRLYKRTGQIEKAMRCFLDALDLDPKDTNLIKAAMEKMDEPDIEEEISEF